MRTIWKYPIRVTNAQIVKMPKGAQILTVQVQDGSPCLWAVVNADAPKEGRVICVFGAGVNFDADGAYVGTFQLPDMGLVFHVFEQS